MVNNSPTYNLRIVEGSTICNLRIVEGSFEYQIHKHYHGNNCGNKYIDIVNNTFENKT